MVEKMTAALKATVFHHRPLVPSVNKWTKLGPCCDVLVFGVLLHGVFTACFETLQIKTCDTPDGDDVVEYAKDVDFAALQGKRYIRALRMLQDRACRFALLALAFTIEPLRFVTAWLMRQCSAVQHVFAIKASTHPPSQQGPRLDPWIVCLALSLSLSLYFLSGNPSGTCFSI